MPPRSECLRRFASECTIRKMKHNKGETFDESELFDDPLTSKLTRRLTRNRDFNQTPTYHLNAAFSADSRFLVMASWEVDGDSYLFKCDVESGTMTVLATLDRSSGERFDGNNVSMVQASEWVATNTGKRLHLCHLDSAEERTLLDVSGTEQTFGHPIGSIDGTRIFIPRHSNAVIPHKTTNVTTTHLEVDIETGAVTELFEDAGRGCNHVVPNPVYPDLLMMDRDMPPGYAHGGDKGRTTRVWILNRKTGSVTEIRPQDENRFQVHSNWNCRGDRVFYHGTSAEGGHYIGAADVGGRTVFERRYPEYHYGHMCSHPCEDVMITDGLFTADQIIKIYYTDLDLYGAPRLEVLARHDTEWTRGQQQSHPHCHVSPDGRWLSYNRGFGGERADVYVVRIR